LESYIDKEDLCILNKSIQSYDKELQEEQNGKQENIDKNAAIIRI